MYHWPGSSPGAIAGYGWWPLTRASTLGSPRVSREIRAILTREASYQATAAELPETATAGRAPRLEISRCQIASPRSLSMNARLAPAFSSSQAAKQPSVEHAIRGCAFLPLAAGARGFVVPTVHSPLLRLRFLSALESPAALLRSGSSS